MTHEQLVEGICSNCRFLEWEEDEDGLGRRFAEVIGCRKECEPFYNEDAECADCDEWEGRKDVYDY